jgi:DNA-binding NarL/FixJ family response regulator
LANEWKTTGSRQKINFPEAALSGQKYAMLKQMSKLPLDALIDTLELLTAQAQAYERALPPDNYPARAAVAALGELARQALNEAQDLAAGQEAAADHPLSPRELEVLGLAAKGLTNKEIAYRLNLSERTIQFHLHSVFNKTTTNSRTEAVALAVSRGWLEP